MVYFSNYDLEEFANWLGFEGADADTFYEAYYDIDYYDDIEAEEAAGAYDSQAWSIDGAIPISLRYCW